MEATAEAERILAEVGLPAEPDLAISAAEYLGRTRRGRWYGLIAGFAVGMVASLLYPVQKRELGLAIPLLLAGYVLGILVAELRAPVPARRARRAAELTPRSSGSLLPRWVRVVMWMSELPVLAAVVLMPLAATLVHGVRGSGLWQSGNLACFGDPLSWPGPGLLAAAGAVAAAGLLISEYGLAALARRPRPADDERRARLDDALRGLSARAIAGGATALGLTLTAMICYSIGELSSANVCRPGTANPVPQYPWLHAHMHPWATMLGLAMLIAAVVTVVKSQRRQDPRLTMRPEPMPGAA
ncbi:MAG: hypothetical protein ACYCO9_08455 [Streptosporangiaceae bacterium]